MLGMAPRSDTAVGSLSWGQTRAAIRVCGHTKAKGAPWRGHVGCGSGPVWGKELHAGGERPPTATERQCSHP